MHEKMESKATNQTKDENYVDNDLVVASHLNAAQEDSVPPTCAEKDKKETADENEDNFDEFFFTGRTSVTKSTKHSSVQSNKQNKKLLSKIILASKAGQTSSNQNKSLSRRWNKLAEGTESEKTTDSKSFSFRKMSYLCRMRVSQLAIQSITALDNSGHNTSTSSEENHVRMTQRDDRVELERQTFLNYILYKAGTADTCKIQAHINLQKLKEDLTKAVLTDSSDQSKLVAATEATIKDKNIISNLKSRRLHLVLNKYDINHHNGLRGTLMTICQTQESYISWKNAGLLTLLLEYKKGCKHGTKRVVGDRAMKISPILRAVFFHTRDKRRKKEVNILRLFQILRAYCKWQQLNISVIAVFDGFRIFCLNKTLTALLQYSLDKDCRAIINFYQGLEPLFEFLNVITKLVQFDTLSSIHCLKCVCNIITNLTLDNAENTALVCSMGGALEALLAQLRSCNESLVEAAAEALRHICMEAQPDSQKQLTEVCAVGHLMKAAMRTNSEKTLDSLLSAAFILSSQDAENKLTICKVNGALSFIVELLKSTSPVKNKLGIDILSSISIQVASVNYFRQILCSDGCLKVLLDHISSTNQKSIFKVVGILWKLAEHSAEDKKMLINLGINNILDTLSYSSDKLLANYTSAFKRFLSSQPCKSLVCDKNIDSSQKIVNNPTNKNSENCIVAETIVSNNCRTQNSRWEL